MGEVAAISFHDDAVKKEHAAFPLSEVDRRGNKRFHNHPAIAGVTYFNRPRDLRKTKSEYTEFYSFANNSTDRNKERRRMLAGNIDAI